VRRFFVSGFFTAGAGLGRRPAAGWSTSTGGLAGQAVAASAGADISAGLIDFSWPNGMELAAGWVYQSVAGGFEIAGGWMDQSEAGGFELVEG
jgi:hypothetical protein